MPETPDFDQIAAPLAEYADDTRRRQIAEQLRLIWNARGAVDLAKIDAILSPTVAAPYVKTMNHAIRGLDR